MEREYKICNRCIMDTSDHDIQFDEKGLCNHCKKYEERVEKELYYKHKDGEQKLNQLVNQIKEKGKNKEYDCIIGVSGGVDSTFVAYIVKKLGLRPLAVHLNNGWNSEISERNIENTCKALDIDLYTSVPDWEEFKDLQLSFLKSSVSNSEIPTDHAIIAFLFQVASERGIPYIIRGHNIVTEAILPSSWGYDSGDLKFINGIHNKFGKVKLKTFPHYNLIDMFNYIFIKKIKFIPILNYIKYDKKEAMRIIEKELGWRYYGGKHYESIYTRFFQGYILPKKFGIDKRRAHLSTLICSGQMTRDEALEEMKKDPYPTEEMMNDDKEYVIKKLGLTEKEFEKIMSLPIKTFTDYPNNYFLISKRWLIVRLAKKLRWA